MTDDFGFPPDRTLPDAVRAQARDRIVQGIRAEPRRRPSRALLPVSIAAGVVVLVGAVVGVVAVNHHGLVTVPANPAVSSTNEVPTTTTPQPSSRTLLFPDRTLTVTLTGYDDTLHMVEFHVSVHVTGGPDDGHYSPDPGDPGPHRLPLAADPTLVALSTVCTNTAPGATTGNPNVDGTSCTPAQFVTTLRSGVDQNATVHVDSTDHIDSVQELYHP
jgi:hypothetical protein